MCQQAGATGKRSSSVCAALAQDCTHSSSDAAAKPNVPVVSSVCAFSCLYP